MRNPYKEDGAPQSGTNYTNSGNEPFGQVPFGEVEKLRQDLHERITEIEAKRPDHEVVELISEIMADKEMGSALILALKGILEKSKQSDET